MCWKWIKTVVETNHEFVLYCIVCLVMTWALCKPTPPRPLLRTAPRANSFIRTDRAKMEALRGCITHGQDNSRKANLTLIPRSCLLPSSSSEWVENVSSSGGGLKRKILENTVMIASCQNKIGWQPAKQILGESGITGQTQPRQLWSIFKNG